MATAFFPAPLRRHLRHTVRQIGPAALLTVSVLVVPARPSLAQHTLGKLVRASGGDPFANSLADHPYAQQGTPVGRSTVEPWIVVNPTNPNNILACFQQDRWTGPDGGARGIVTAVSFDGGLTWGRTSVPGIALTTGGTYERASDPWVAFSPDGSAYVVSLPFNDTTAGSAVMVNKSTNGGLTWSKPVTLISDTTAAFDDKESVTADPFDFHYVYVVWDRSGVPYIARTVNGGANWLTAQPLLPSGYSDFTIGNQIVVAPNGTLYDFFSDASTGDLRAFYSTDHGATWSLTPIDAAQLLGVGVYDPVGGQALRITDGFAATAIDPNNGNIYIAWGDARFTGGQIDEIAFSQSTDGGATWSSPIKINKTPTNILTPARQAFMPTIAVAADGTIAVTYYDFRHTTTGPALLTDDWIVFCKPTASAPATNPANWGGELRLSGTSFDFHLAPDADGGRFIGDYCAMQPIGNDFIAVLGKTSTYYPSATYTRRIFAK